MRPFFLLLTTAGLMFGVVASAIPTAKSRTDSLRKKPASRVNFIDPGKTDLSIGQSANKKNSPGLDPSASKRIGDLVKESSSSTNSTSSASSATGKSSGGNGVSFDDNAAKGEVGKAPPPSPNSAGDISGGGSAAPVGEIKAFDRWFPACVFLDPGIPNGNTMVKGLVDMAAKCGVNLVVFPFYIKNTPGSSQEINDKARQSCNAIQGMGQFGVNRAASATVVRNPGLAAQMCNTGNRDRDTCEELTFSPGETYLQRAEMTGRGSYKNNPTGAGIVARNNAAALATSIFREITGLPYGDGGGLNLGSWNEGDASAAGLSKQDGLSPFGCQQLQNSSYPNTDGKWKWNSAQETYVVAGEKERMFDLGKPIFTPPQGPPNGGETSGDGANGGAAGLASGDSGPKGVGAGSSSSPTGSGGAAESSGGGGHKKRPGSLASGSGGQGNSTSVRTLSDPAGTGASASGPGELEGSSNSDAAASALAAAGGTGGVSGGAGRGPASVGMGNGQGTEYDDKASKVAASSSLGQLKAGKGSKGGDSVGSLDPNFFKKKDPSAKDGATVFSRRPRTIASEGRDPGSALSLEYFKKIGQGAKFLNRYKGPVTDGEVTSLRRGTEEK